MLSRSPNYVCCYERCKEYTFKLTTTANKPSLQFPVVVIFKKKDKCDQQDTVLTVLTLQSMPKKTVLRVYIYAFTSKESTEKHVD